MRLQMYVGYDKAANVHSQPIFTKNDATAKRIFGGIVNGKDERHPYQTNPEDFQIICIGTYDDEAGKMYKSHVNEQDEKIEEKRLVCEMIEIKVEESSNA